jgi:hypothetical protein
MQRASRRRLASILFSLIPMSAATAALADEAPPPAPTPAPEPAPAAAPAPAPAATTTAEAPHAEAAAHPLIGGGVPFISGGVSDSPLLVGGVGLDPGIVIAAGFTATYNSKGLPGPGGMPMEDKFQGSVVLYGAYFPYNKAPVAVGPEVTVGTSVAPGDPFDAMFVRPGLVFYCAPWKAPILLGGAVDVKINFVKGAGGDRTTTLDAVTPGLRIIYAFHLG